jgi:hypothetical protein
VKSSLILIFVFICNLAFATILTVDNRIPSGGQYLTFDAAYIAAANGDTLHLLPSPTPYSVSNNISKQIHVYGGGFDYSGSVSGPNRTEISSTFYFITGSAGSSISGIKISGTIVLNDNDISISNTHITGLLEINGNNVSLIESKLMGIYIVSSRVNTLIHQCLIYGPGYDSGNDKIGLKIGSSTIAVISNSIIHVEGASYHSSYGVSIGSGCEIELSNNYINSAYSNGYALFSSSVITATNNILYSNVSADFTYFHYNLFSDDFSSLPPTNSDLFDVPALFLDWVNMDFHLAPGSLAIGFGEGGVDCGPYGGASPFNDNYNISPLPSIIELHAPTVVVPAEGPMPVQIRATTSGN